MTGMRVASFFAGLGGLDLGFQRAGFDVTWANEYDKRIHPSYAANYPECKLDTRSIVDVQPEDIPDVDGMIGGPPCQSWSEAGAKRGITDKRGQLFYEYLRLLEEKRPLFFLAENVSGILAPRNEEAFTRILSLFSQLGYNVSYGLLRASDYDVPQDRDRVIIVGYQVHTGKFFTPPTIADGYEAPTLKTTIWDLRSTAKPALNGRHANAKLRIPNHEYLVSGWSPMYMSRNRVRGWNQQSFTIQASGRQAPLHPGAPAMMRVDSEHYAFVRGKENLYRRVTVREAARIQTFPDSHIILYDQVEHGYKMVGNAVPVEFARHIAERIRSDLKGFAASPKKGASGSVKRYYR